MSILDTFRSFKGSFWLANAQEACERLAYFGVRAILPLMMVSTGTGGLGLSYTQKAIIYGLWAFIQCMVPMVSGGFSESFGYKKSLIVAFCINTAGYLVMANVLNIAALAGFHDINTTFNFIIMLIAGCTIGLGTAIFKPPVQGIVAKSVNKKTSGVGFGIFYWVVNIGGFLAPILAATLRGNEAAPTWSYVFYGAAFVTLFNLVITLFLFEEPVRTEEDTAKHQNETIGQVFVKTLKTLWNDKNMLAFLLIISAFWLMFMQLWDLLPNFIDEWVDRRGVGEFMHKIPGIRSLEWYEADGSLKPEMLIDIDSAAIILFVLPLSALFSKFKMMTALFTGMAISVVGFILGGLTMSGGICALAIFIFAIGEIICSPKFSEYIGVTAPKDKKATYMGYSNIPFAIGWAVGNFISGPLYDAFSSKLKIGHAWLTNHGITNIRPEDLDIANARQFLMSDTVGMKADDLPKLTNTKGLDLDQLKNLLTQNNLNLSDACQTKFADVADSAEQINECLISEAQNLLSKQDLNNLINVIQSKNLTDIPVDYCNMKCVLDHINPNDAYAATEVLWESSSPWVIWLILGAIGVVSMIGMIAFYFKSGMSKQDAAGETEDDDSKDEESEENAENNDDASTSDDNATASKSEEKSDSEVESETSQNDENSSDAPQKPSDT